MIWRDPWALLKRTGPTFSYILLRCKWPLCHFVGGGCSLDEQLAQNQTIDTLRRQVESSNTSAQQAQALLRAYQEQQSWMLPPNTNPSGAGGVIGNTPFIQPLSTPSTGLRTRDLHGPGYYHIGSPADQGYADHMQSTGIATKSSRSPYQTRTDCDKVKPIAYGMQSTRPYT